MLKRLFSIITISLIISGSFFSFYSYNYSVYADTNTDNWQNVTTNAQLVEAFRYYCKSRDLTIDGSIADGVTQFTTKTFNGLCKTLGIDMTALQAQIKYQTDGNIGNRFLFTSLGIDAYNRIFAQFLQDNNLSVGDTADEQNNLLYSGKVFTDLNGNSCLCYVKQSSGNVTSGASSLSDIFLNSGTSYYPSMAQVVNQFTLPYEQEYNFTSDDTYYVRFNENQNTSSLRRIQIQYNKSSNGTYSSNYTFYDYYKDNDVVGTSSEPIICYYLSDNSYHYGLVQELHRSSDGVFTTYAYRGIHTIVMGNASLPNATVYLTTNNTVINNNNYEGDTVINNNGDTNNYYPDNPDTPDPPTIPDSGGWQDFTLPEMPNDWLIYGMEKKFPFDIPFNILFGLSLLNHEPEIPQFEGDIDLKVCTWHYDIDLTPFDDIAKILRKFEVLAFIIGLAMITKELIMWG